ncbi:ubiquinone biosynthesis protein [Leptospira yasudae]|uniref:class I SAM-dependent methyltransferase n=1 Tax=Leptospira yasudae TaxID=2202201 RepID=UPI000E59C24E|nr:class I SAM-dependent methyltransferase [Leptospira yasudae]RHX96260.1 ubiquinone biosynthesis protein [Leptospira yasudae]
MSANYDPQYIKELFNGMSKTYERVNFITSFGFSIRWRRQFLNSIPRTNEKIEIIDLMTGMGETWGGLRKNFPNSRISALDFSDGMLEYANAKNRRSFRNEIQVIHENVLENRLEANHYDIVISAFGLKTFDRGQMEILAQETKRILKPGGRYSYIEVSSPKNFLLYFLYKIHLKYVVPFFGKLILGNPTQYKMLWKYTESFQNSDSIARIFESAGLDVERKTYFGGCATGITGRKAVA